MNQETINSYNQTPCLDADMGLNVAGVSSDISLTQAFSDVSPLSAVASNIRSPLSSPNSLVPVFRSPNDTPPNSTIAKYLVAPSLSTPISRKTQLPRARLLTSTAALEILNEKERKKQQEADLKEQKRKEREEMKQKKLEEQSRKVEERTRKAEQRAKERAEREEEKARKAAEKAQKAQSKGKQPVKRTRDSTRSMFQPEQKIPRLDVDSFDESECCVCCVMYDEDQSGKDWVSCACGRWLHEDCAYDCVVDGEGKERLCPMCLNTL